MFYFYGKYIYKCLQEQITMILLYLILNLMVTWCLTKTTSWYNQGINTQSQLHTTATSAEKQQLLLGTPFHLQIGSFWSFLYLTVILFQCEHYTKDRQINFTKQCLCYDKEWTKSFLYLSFRHSQ